jgi:hypothetical protein
LWKVSYKRRYFSFQFLVTMLSAFAREVENVR